jgi:hypothetical protein
MLAGFCALLRSVLLDLPSRRDGMKRRRKTFRPAASL